MPGIKKCCDGKAKREIRKQGEQGQGRMIGGVQVFWAGLPGLGVGDNEVSIREKLMANIKTLALYFAALRTFLQLNIPFSSEGGSQLCMASSLFEVAIPF